MSKDVFTELSKEKLEEILLTLNNNQAIIIKFGAEWCEPCKKIRELVYSNFATFDNNVICVDLDVDDNFEIYANYKVKKQINGIPKIFVYFGKKTRDHWYLPDDSVSGADFNDINNFFDRIRKNIK